MKYIFFLFLLLKKMNITKFGPMNRRFFPIEHESLLFQSYCEHTLLEIEVLKQVIMCYFLIASVFRSCDVTGHKPETAKVLHFDNTNLPMS